MTKKIKILFTIPNFDTAGSGKSVYDLLNRIDRTVFEPEVSCFHDRGDLFKEIEKLDVKIHIFTTSVVYRPFITLPLRVWRVKKFFKKNKFDLIHSWHWSSDFTEPLAAKLAGIPFIYTKKAMGWGNKSWRWKTKLSTKIVSVNKEIPNLYYSHILDKVQIIPLCVDVNRFTPQNQSYAVIEDKNWNKDKFIIVSVANLAPVKGIELLCQAVLNLKDSDIKLAIIGDNQNDYGEKLKQEFDSHENIKFIDKKLDVRPYLAMTDLFVIPTKDEGRKEGLPIAPMEAMASERIVIGSNITGINEVLEEFQDCLFETGNVEDLMKKILFIRQMSRNDRTILAKCMRRYVVENLSIERFISEHETLYKSLLP